MSSGTRTPFLENVCICLLYTSASSTSGTTSAASADVVPLVEDALGVREAVFVEQRAVESYVADDIADVSRVAVPGIEIERESLIAYHREEGSEPRQVVSADRRTADLDAVSYTHLDVYKRQDLRIDKALELLRDTDDTIDDIAGRCGFNTPMYFREMFRNVTGMTPAGYRKAASHASL